MDDAELLQRLSTTLRRSGMPTQTEISRGVGVDQPLVSRAKRGELKRVTERVRRLYEYADGKAEEVSRAGKRRERRAAEGPRVAHDVLSDCRAYLDDGLDPLVLRDQIRVLRRAQRC